jgi:hypothetical protein
LLPTTEAEGNALVPEHLDLSNITITMVHWSQKVMNYRTGVARLTQSDNFRARHKPPAKMLDFLLGCTRDNKSWFIQRRNFVAKKNALMVLNAENWYAGWSSAIACSFRRQAFAASGGTANRIVSANIVKDTSWDILPGREGKEMARPTEFDERVRRCCRHWQHRQCDLPLVSSRLEPATDAAESFLQ